MASSASVHQLRRHPRPTDRPRSASSSPRTAAPVSCPAWSRWQPSGVRPSAPSPLRPAARVFSVAILLVGGPFGVISARETRAIQCQTSRERRLHEQKLPVLLCVCSPCNHNVTARFAGLHQESGRLALARDAQVMVGDVILAFNDRPIDCVADYRAALKQVVPHRVVLCGTPVLCTNCTPPPI